MSGNTIQQLLVSDIIYQVGDRVVSPHYKEVGMFTGKILYLQLNVCGVQFDNGLFDGNVDYHSITIIETAKPIVCEITTLNNTSIHRKKATNEATAKIGDKNSFVNTPTSNRDHADEDTAHSCQDDTLVKAKTIINKQERTKMKAKESRRQAKENEELKKRQKTTLTQLWETPQSHDNNNKRKHKTATHSSKGNNRNCNHDISRNKILVDAPAAETDVLIISPIQEVLFEAGGSDNSFSDDNSRTS